MGACCFKNTQSESSNYTTDDHLLSLQELTGVYGTRLSLTEIRRSAGLTAVDARARLLKDGPNTLTPPKKVPEWYKFGRHLLNPFMLLMDGAGVLSIITFSTDTSQPINLWLGLLLFGVVLFTSAMGYWGERQTSRITSAFKNMLPSDAIVIRDGEPSRVKASELVVGDLVSLSPGLKVPADVRLVHVSGLKIEMSSLTGEARPVSMSVTAISRESVIEARNIAFSSALVIDGTGTGIVTRVGDNTYIGCIAHLSSGMEAARTTMYQEIQRFVIAITGLSVVTSVILSSVGAARHFTAQYILINAVISVIVANVPQGLPATVVSLLHIACSSLSKLNVFVKRSEIIESLGSASVICSYKTGTLTMNLMSVDAIWFNKSLDSLRNVSFPSMHASATTAAAKAATGSLRNMAGIVAAAEEAKPGATPRARPSQTVPIISPAKSDAGDVVIPVARSGSFHHLIASYQPVMNNTALQYVDLTLIASVNNSARHDAEVKEHIIGDASEAALLRFCDGCGVTEPFRAAYSIVFSVPFSASSKFSAVVCEHPALGDQHIVLLKGAPEVVMGKCNRYLLDDHSCPIDSEFLGEEERANGRMAGAGQRVLAFARLLIPAQDASQYTLENFPHTGYQFVGLIGLTDPPKPGVPDAINTFHEAGIRVFMVTGDQPATAEAIGRQVNLITGPTLDDVAAERGVDIADIDPLTDPDVRSIVLAGTALVDLPEATWDLILAKPEIVFARTTPQQKLEIVKQVQRKGWIVAVTGDGVNDAPALKQANIGVSMGKNASDVAREAADIVLMDDNFCSMVPAIQAGRLIYDNLLKTIAYTITHLCPELFPVILSLLFGLPLGLQALIVLSIDLGTELAPAISLSNEQAESDVMKRPPRDLKKDRLLTFGLMFYSYGFAGIFECATCLATYAMIFRHYGLYLSDVANQDSSFQISGNSDITVRDVTYDNAFQIQIMKEINAAWFMNIAMCQVFHIWAARSRFDSIFAKNPFRNMSLNYGVLIELGIIFLDIYTPGFQGFFQTAAPPAFSYVAPVVFGVAFIAITELIKYRRRQKPGSMRFVTY